MAFRMCWWSGNLEKKEKRERKKKEEEEKKKREGREGKVSNIKIKFSSLPCMTLKAVQMYIAQKQAI